MDYHLFFLATLLSHEVSSQSRLSASHQSLETPEKKKELIEVKCFNEIRKFIQKTWLQLLQVKVSISDFPVIIHVKMKVSPTDY